MRKYNFKDVEADLKQSALLAGKLLIEKITDDFSVTEKSSFKDLVTTKDIEIQSFIVNHIKEKYNQALFVSEEMNNNREYVSSELIFVIDPIDGTANYTKGMKYSCVSIGCLFDGEPVVGVVYNPYTNEMFSAAKGHGAYLNEEPIRVPDMDLSKSLVLFGTSPYDTDTTEDTFEKVKKIYLKCLDIRRLGSAALDICNVACGRAGLYFEGRLSLWDYAAAAAVLSEAGGKFCNYNGQPVEFTLDKTSVIAGNASIIENSGLIEEK